MHRRRGHRCLYTLVIDECGRSRDSGKCRCPGPIWTPLIPSTFPPDQVAEFGATQPMKRPGQPEELAPAYVYLASTDSSYVSGQVIHVNGGEVING